MSLINDALKRASQSSKQGTPPRSPTAGAPLQPVVGGRKRRTSRQTVLIVMSSIAVLGLGAALWAFLDARKHSGGAPPNSPAVTQSNKVATDSPPQDKPKSAAPAASPNVPAAAEAPSSTVSTTPISTPVASPGDKPPADVKPHAAPPVVAASAKPQKAAPAAPGSPTPAPPRADPPKVSVWSGGKSFPAVKLQGIVFRIKNPSVLINGKVLALGEELDGMVVKKIERSTVTLEWNAQTKVFSLK